MSDINTALRQIKQDVEIAGYASIATAVTVDSEALATVIAALQPVKDARLERQHRIERQLGKPRDYMCPANFNNMDCNSCHGRLCGQRYIPPQRKQTREKQEMGMP
jgi:hypothetical protein